MSNPNSAIPPLIPENSSFQTISVENLSVTGSNLGPVSFFGVDASEQQDGAANQNNNGEITQASDHDAIVSLLNNLRTYGLIKHEPIFTGRTITFTNLTTNSPALSLYVTKGGKGNSLEWVHTFSGTIPHVYPIPPSIGWTGNFQVWPVGMLPTDQLGATLFEIAVNNQVYKSVVETFSITSGGTGYSVANGVDATGGSGVGLKVDIIVVTAGVITTASIVAAGSGYLVGDVVTITGGGANATFTILTVSEKIPLPLRDDWDVSTVPPNLPVPGLDCGPRDQAVSVSYAPIMSYGSGYTVASGLATTVSPAGGTGLTVDLVSVGPGGSLTYPICFPPYNTPGIGGYVISDFGTGYSAGDVITVVQGGGSGGQLKIGTLTEEQSKSYNVGFEVIPPAPPSDTATYPALQNPGPYWPPVTVTCSTIDGNCPEAITYPNDTALPKSQLGYAQGNYTVNIIDPTIVVII